jgi:hypothetical protein
MASRLIKLQPQHSIFNLVDEVIRLPGRFRFRGTAIGAGGHITMPFNELIELQATSALPEIGGHGTARSVDFRCREILRFDLAQSEVTGSQCTNGDGKPVFSTRIKSTVEGLNVMDMVTADRIVANLVSTCPEAGEPSVKLLGSRFENLRVAGIPIKVVPALDVLDRYSTHTSLLNAYGSVERVRDLFGDESLRERFHEAPPQVARWFSHPVEANPEMPAINGISSVSLVRKLEPEGEELDCWGHVIRVEGFGTVRLGEVSVSSLSRSVTMLQIDLNCPFVGRMMFCTSEDGCNPG